MNTSVTKYYPVSSSEEESSDDSNHLSEKTTEPLDETINEILSKVKKLKYSFHINSESNVLYSEDVTEDDEVWLLQTPNEVQLDFHADFPIDFSKDITKIKLKTGKKRKKFNAISIKNSTDHITCVLPEKKTKQFNLNVLPLAGRIILQEDIKFGREKITDTITSRENSFIHEDLINSTTNSSFDDVKLFENNKAIKKKKKSMP